MKITILALVAAVAASIAAGAAQARTTSTHVAVTAGKPSEFGFKLSIKTVKLGSVVFAVKNGGAIPHDFKICSAARTNDTPNTCAGKVTKLLSPGQSASLTYVFKKKGKYEYLCTVPGHAAGGMKGLLTVK